MVSENVCTAKVAAGGRSLSEAAKDCFPGQTEELKNRLTWEIWEWTDWAREIEDAELVAEAAKMDIRLDDMPPPYSEDEERRSHYEIGNFGNRLLHNETRLALRTQIRELGPAFRKEKRESIELHIKIATGLTGLLGTATGLVALQKK
jgi:hypothetical protein